MIKILSLSFSVLFTLHLLANDYTLEIPSTIKAVTVYEAGAQVERNAKTTLPAGASVLTFDDLPHYLDINKVQFTGEGDFVIQSIYFTYRSDTLNLSEIKAFKAPEDPAPNSCP